MSKQFLILLFLALTAYGQQTSVAVLPSDSDDTALKNNELEALTDEMREAALKVLPTNAFVLLKQDVVIKRLGGAENYIKECRESSCIVDLGKKAQVDYVAQASVMKLGNKIRLKVELYNVRTEGLVGMFNDEAENVRGLLEIVKKKAPDVFGKIPSASSGKVASPTFTEGISDLTTGRDYNLDEGKRYLVNLNTEPSDAILSFDGAPSTSCTKTPCKLELAEGNVRIVAALDQYERADTTVFIKQKNQNIIIKLKPNFGVLEIKPAYLDGIGKDVQWNLSINGKSYSLGEVKLSPNKYSVRMNHECYENISFEVGINKGKREVFNMANNITLKKGGLILSAERNGEPVSEPVFVNGKQAGETPFTSSVPLCAKVEIGKSKEIVDVKLKYNEKVKYTYKGSNKFITDERDGKKYKVVTIGEQTWMAQNLNYKAIGSECYGNNEANCNKYGRLYNLETAMKACPSGWHLPTKTEWQALITTVGGEYIAGKYLKASSGWNDYEGRSGNGEDAFDFRALPGGCGGLSCNVGNYGGWWAANALNLDMGYNYERTYWSSNGSGLFSVRCVQGPPPAMQTNSEVDMGSGEGGSGRSKAEIMACVEGSRSKAEIMAVVNARMPGLRNIYNKYLKLKPGFGGKVVIRFTIAPSGDIVSINIVSSTTGYADFDNAVKNTIATWKLKATKCGNTTPTIPFNFED